MQDQETLEQKANTVFIIATVMSIVSLTFQMFSLFVDFTPPYAHFAFGLIMVATAIAYAVSATLKTVYRRSSNGMGPGLSWFIMGCWLVNMTTQFAKAAWH